MAKFSHYYLKYDLSDLYAQEHKARRQQLFGEMLEKDDSISFILGEGEQKKHYKHAVKHLRLNHDIIVMRIANDTTKEVIQDFKKKSVRHEPPCYVIFDNREHCRRVAIQNNREAWASTRSVAEVMTKVLGDAMMRNCNIGISMTPSFIQKISTRLGACINTTPPGCGLALQAVICPRCLKTNLRMTTASWALR